MKEEHKNGLKDNLNDLLNNLDDEVPGINSNEKSLEKSKKDVVNNRKKQNSIKENAKRKAKKTMKTLLQFYYKEDVINNNEYAKAKANLEEMSLAYLLEQLENNRNAIDSLMTIIDEGEVSPRIFEVFSDLQKTMLDILKNKSLMLMSIEENAKKINREIEIQNEQNEENSKDEEKPKSGVKTRGNKDLMKAIQKSINTNNIKNIDDENGDKNEK